MQHLQASGGIDALMKMQSISRYGHITFYEKNKIKDIFCYHTDIIYPLKLREQNFEHNLEGVIIARF